VSLDSLTSSEQSQQPSDPQQIPKVR